MSMSMSRKLLAFILFVCAASVFLFGQLVYTPEGGYAPSSRLVMVWDYIENEENNSVPDKRVAHKELDIISPTWFAISNTEGDISSLADREYVGWAHDNGLAVWALFENSSDGQRTFAVLSDKNTRKKMIDQIAGYAQAYSLDGINIDFEAMTRETGEYFEEFIIELYERLKPLDICLSVDIPLPIDGIQKVYDLNLLAGNVDYVVVMAYDQHHAESPVIGPAAAIGWVKQGIEDTLQYVPHDKVILGVPFFARVWLENRENGELEITSEFMGMQEAYDLFSENASIWQRDDETGQIYAEFDQDLKCYKAWLEDEHSLSLKLDAVNDYNLAGVSAWRRGLEQPEIWDMIDAYFD